MPTSTRIPSNTTDGIADAEVTIIGGSVTATIPAGTVFGVTDNGGSLTVDGAVNATITNASLAVTSLPGAPLPVSGLMVTTSAPGDLVTVFDHTDISTTVRSLVVDKGNATGCSFDVTCIDAGGLTGTLQADVCNEIYPTASGVLNPTPNWQPITLSDGSTEVSITGYTQIALDLDPVRFKYVSLYFQSTGGTGTIYGVLHVGPG